MSSITRTITVTRKGMQHQIQVVEGTSLLPISVIVSDYDILSGSAAVAYNRQPNGTLVNQACTISENTISFTPPEGFYLKGYNKTQVRVTNNNRNLFSFVIDVWCDENITDDADVEEINSQPTLVTQLLSQIGVLTARMDAFTALPEGSTTSDAALNDIRIGYDGTEYPTPGDAVRGQVGSLSEDLIKLDNGEIIYFSVNESDLESGGINYSDGTLVDKANVKRTRDFIPVEVGKKLSVYCKNGNGVNLIFYNNDESYGESRAVQATSTTTSRTVTINYPKLKIEYIYYSPSYPISVNNVGFYTVSSIDENLEALKKFLYETTPFDSYNFDDLTNGYYFVSRDSIYADLSNAPNDMKYGNFFVFAHPIGTAVIQFAYSSTNELNVKRGWFRVFNNNSVIIKWSDLNIMYHKSQDKYVAFGDSITHGYQKTVDGHSLLTNYQYWKTVSNTLKLFGEEGANTGSGYVYIQGNKNGLRIIEEYDFSDVNLVSIAFGTNDWNANIPLGSIDDTAENKNINTSGTYTNSENTLYSAIKYCVEKILESNPKIILVLITPINRTQIGNSGAALSSDTNWAYGARNTAGYTLGDVCKAVVDVAQYYGVPYIDNREGNPINRITLPKLTVDGLHLTDYGYMKLGQFYAGKIGAIYRPYEI